MNVTDVALDGPPLFFSPVAAGEDLGAHWPTLALPNDIIRSADDSLFRFVNFIQRQMFVLRTHRSRTERWVNLFLMWLTATTSATLGFNMLVSDI